MVFALMSILGRARSIYGRGRVREEIGTASDPAKCLELFKILARGQLCATHVVNTCKTRVNLCSASASNFGTRSKGAKVYHGQKCHPVLHHWAVIFSGLLGSWIVCCLGLKIKSRSCARGRRWNGLCYDYWWTALMKLRLLFSPCVLCLLRPDATRFPINGAGCWSCIQHTGQFNVLRRFWTFCLHRNKFKYLHETF